MLVFATLLAVIIALTSLLISGLVLPFKNKPIICPQTPSPQSDPIPPTTTVLNEADTKCSSYYNDDDDDDDGDSSSTTTLPTCTPRSTIVDEVVNNNHTITDAFSSASSVPWPGSMFFIRSVVSGEVIMLRDGNITLDAQPDGRGSSHWACVETKGWLGFQNIDSGKLLGHDVHGTLHCASEQHQMWEYFCTRVRPDGRGCVLLMTHWERLWHVGVKFEGGVRRLAKIGDGGVGGISWEFVRV